MIYQKRYTWNNVNRPVSADVVGRTLEQLEKQNGYVDKVSLLDVSRPADSPTHALFEWNDSVAAERYRLDQSRRIINDLLIEVVEREVEEVPAYLCTEGTDASELAGRWAVAFVNCGDSRQSNVKYTNIVRAMTEEESRTNVLRHAMAELQMFQRKYSGYVELTGVFSEIERLKMKGA